MTEDVGAGWASGDSGTGNADGAMSAAGDVAGEGTASIGVGGGAGGGGSVPLVVEWASVMLVLLTVRVMYHWRCREGVAGGAVGGGVTGGADGDGAAGRVDFEGCCSSGGGAGVRCWWCGSPGGGEARSAVVRVAGDAVGDGGAAGGVSGCGALDDVDGEGVACGGSGDVGDGNGERAMAMLVMPMRGGVVLDVTGGGRGLCTGWWWCWWCRRRGCCREQQVRALRVPYAVIVDGVAGGASGGCGRCNGRWGCLR